MRLIIFAALTAAVAASPLRDLLPRQATCPPTSTGGVTGPFRLQIEDSEPMYDGRYGQMSGAGTAFFIIFNTYDPDQTRVGNFYLDSNGQLMNVKGESTMYAYKTEPKRYIALSPDASVANKIKCTMNPTTCALNCQLPNGADTDCLGSPADRPEWRIGNPGVVKPGCPAFTPTAQTSDAAPASVVEELLSSIGL